MYKNKETNKKILMLVQQQSDFAHLRDFLFIDIIVDKI